MADLRRSTHTAEKGVAITPGTPFSPCRAVNCGSAGASTVTWPDGSTSSYYFVLGTNILSITNIASGGAGSDFVALY